MKRNSLLWLPAPPAHDRHARATAALARSLDRARGVALAMAMKKEAVGYTARHVRHENRASLVRTSTPSTRIARVITEFPVPPGHARVAAAAALARRSIVRTRCGVGDGGGGSGRLHRASRASPALRVTRADAHVTTIRRARHCRFPSPPVHDRHARSAVAAALARSRAHGAALALAVEVAVGYTAHHERHARVTRTHEHAIAVFRPPLARPERAR